MADLIEWSEEQRSWILPHNEGRAVLPKSKTILGILLKDGVVVLDGHHKVFMSQVFGAGTVPVEVAEDWRHMSVNEAFSRLVEEGKIFPYDKWGNPLSQLVRWSELEDEPFRYFVSQILLKIKASQGRLNQVDVRGWSGNLDRSIIGKINRDISFHEQTLALALRLDGLNELPISPFTYEILEATRQRLIGMQNHPHPAMSALSQILIFPEVVSMSGGVKPSDHLRLASYVESLIERNPFCAHILK